MGPAVGRLRKVHKKMPDHVVHTVQLGRLINICGHFNGHKKNCVNQRTVQDGTFTFLQGTCPEKKRFSLQKFHAGTEMLIYRYKFIQNFSTALFFRY